MLTAGLVATVTLPALSATEALAVSPEPPPVMTVSAGQPPARPDSVSSQVQWIVIGPAYQPAPFGAVVGAPLSVGAALSTLTPLSVAPAVLPAVSTAVLVAVWLAPSPKLTL